MKAASRLNGSTTGAWRFTKADGHTLHTCTPGCTQPLGDWTVLRESNREGGINIDANTAATGWRGERMDYGIAIDALLLTESVES